LKLEDHLEEDGDDLKVQFKLPRPRIPAGPRNLYSAKR
jgi:hypothetical protein